MKMNIELEASSFEKVIKDGLENLPKEELAEILKQVIMESFNKCPTLHGALVETTGDYYNKQTKLGPLAEAAVKEIKFGPEIEEIKKAMLDDLKKNYREILAAAIMKNLLENFTLNAVFSNLMESSMKQGVEEILYRRQGQGQ